MFDTERSSDIQKKTELGGQRLVTSLDRPVMDSCCLLGSSKANSFVAANLLERRHFTDY